MPHRGVNRLMPHRGVNRLMPHRGVNRLMPHPVDEGVNVEIPITNCLVVQYVNEIKTPTSLTVKIVRNEWK
jgi:hypothetical protein